MYTAQTVYDEVCYQLLEDGALTYVYTEAAFLRDLQDSIRELLQATGIVSDLYVLKTESGEESYTLPVEAVDIQAVYIDDEFIEQSSGFYKDREDPIWQGEDGTPAQWRQDQLAANIIELSPVPDFNGTEAASADVAGFYGTVQGSTNGVDFEFAAGAEEFYGTISDISGAFHVESRGPFWGTISRFVMTPGNVAVITTATADTSESLTLDSPLELIPDTFASYLKWMCLEKIFSQDGEGRDMQRAYYCAARKQEAINMAKAVVAEDVRLMPEEEAAKRKKR